MEPSVAKGTWTSVLLADVLTTLVSSAEMPEAKAAKGPWEQSQSSTGIVKDWLHH